MTHEKVWESLLLRDSRNVKHFVNLAIPASYQQGYVDFQRKYRRVEEIPASEYPTHIFVGLRDVPKRKRDSLPDVFVGQLSVIVVSAAMHDLLQKFSLGRTLFTEVPFFENDQKTKRPGRWFIMHMREDKKTLVPEMSDGIKRALPELEVWRGIPKDKEMLAIDPETARDLDLWKDQRIPDRVFFSDRLKVAIKESGLSARWLGFRPCRVVARGV